LERCSNNQANSSRLSKVELPENMEDGYSGGSHGSYEAQLERTIQELNSMKRQLEDAVNQVRSKCVF
jgi:hypothetical protein